MSIDCSHLFYLANLPMWASCSIYHAEIETSKIYLHKTGGEDNVCLGIGNSDDDGDDHYSCHFTNMYQVSHSHLKITCRIITRYA
jgi:hypothetical protein